MALSFVATIFSAPLFAQYSPEQLGSLPMGYDQTWTARLLHNPEGGYNMNGLHDWPVLYEAQASDVYTITLPTATRNVANGIVQFRTPITLQANHVYRVKATLQANNAVQSVNMVVSEGMNDEVELLSQNVTLEAGVSYPATFSNLRGIDIADAKLCFNIASANENTILKISKISIYDQTNRTELWTGTSFFNYCIYRNAWSGQRLRDMEIEGRTETMSWTQADFNDSQWSEAPMPIGNDGYMAEVKTIWQGADNTSYWIRRDFELAEVKSTTAYFLHVCHDDSYCIYVNGNQVDYDERWTNGKSPVTIEIPASYLKVGRNVIATNIQQNFGGKFYDCGMTIRLNEYEESDPDADITKLQASEVTVANLDQTLDFSWNYGSWVELYNNSSKRVSLSGLYVSDDPTQLAKAQLSPNYGVIPAYGYKCIYFDHKDDGVYGDLSHKQVPFKLQTDGGTLYISQDGVTPLLTIDYPAAIARCSWARRLMDADEWGYNGLPTPGAVNSPMFAEERLLAPEVDMNSQLFTNAMHVHVNIPDGCTLRYTTDGSTPTLQNGEVSADGMFEVTATQIYRFRLFREGYLPSAVVTRSYIYREKDYYLPVIAITTNPENLYGDSIGIITDGVNGVEGRNYRKSNRNMDWQRPANVEYITPEGEMVINQEANICISGGWSRHYLPTSLKLKANKLFEGESSFDYPFFPNKPFNKYKQLLVRNGGNDNDNTSHGRVRDAITQQVLISNGFYVDAQDYQPVHVFLNGKYYGMLNLREPNNRFNGTANYGYDDDMMDSFEYSNGYFQMAGTRDAFDEWLQLSRNAGDDNVYEQIRQKVDIDEVINYWAAITYIGCSDWIMNDNNSKGYRSLPDGKFHLTVLDQDWGWSNTNGVELVNGRYYNDLLAIYNGMKQNKQFQRQFVDAYCILHGSVFTPNRCQHIADSICQLVNPALKMEGRTANTSWNEQRSNMTSTPARNNRINALRNAYGLGSGMKAKVKANIPQASIMLNNQPIPEAKLDGVLFAPFTLTASAPAGYRFLGWQTNIPHSVSFFERDSEWRYYDQGRLDGNDWKTSGFDDSKWSEGKAPLGYYTGGLRDYNTTLSYGGNSSQKYIAYYFRKQFEYPYEPADGDAFIMNYTADDGFVVYVNGQEVYRYLMPEGEITYDTYATTYAYNNPDNGTFEIPAKYLHKGVNTIAVEVHNNVPGSSDIYWSASLSARVTGSDILLPGNQLVVEKDEDSEMTACFEPIPEAEAIAAGATPIRINEVSAGNDIYVNEYAKRDDWIELYNTTNQDIDVKGMFLSDKANDPEKYQIEAVDGISTIVPANGHLLVWASKRDAVSQLHAPFKLDNADGCFVSLRAADGSWQDVLRYDEHESKQTYGRYPDGSNDTYTMSTPTIRKTNRLSTYDFQLAELEMGERPDTCAYTFDLEKGWNWFSHNMASPVSTTRLTEDISAIRASHLDFTKDEQGEWMGQLRRLYPTEGYKVLADQAHSITLTDYPYDTALPATIQKGWNWIGCPLSNPTTIEAALGNFQATEGDILVSQEAFAVYTNGAWNGTLTTVSPGHAYMLKSGFQQAFEWNAVTHRLRRQRRYEVLRSDDGYWCLDIHAHADVMPIIAQLQSEGKPVTGRSYEVAAFVGEECRGMAHVENGYVYLLVHGDAKEPVTFHMVDGSGNEYELAQQLDFTALNMTGTLASPFILSIDNATGVQKTMASERVQSTEYYTLDGRRVAKPIRGIYLRRNKYENGRVDTDKALY